MIYHVLNGDGLAEYFDLEGEKVICREALIEGDVKAENIDAFWKVRAEFIEKEYQKNSYRENVAPEFEKLKDINDKDEVNLWFGNELFCQVNMWFCLSLLEKSNAKIFRIFPDTKGWDCSFEKDSLAGCLKKRKQFSDSDLLLGVRLWKAYRDSDFSALRILSNSLSPCFINLGEVCKAEIEKASRPKEVIERILETGESEFSTIFSEFKKGAGVYGYGDLQVKRLLKLFPQANQHHR